MGSKTWDKIIVNRERTTKIWGALRPAIYPSRRDSLRVREQSLRRLRPRLRPLLADIRGQFGSGLKLC